MTTLKAAVRRRPWAVSVALGVREAAARLGVRRRGARAVGATHRGLSTAESVEYLDRVFADYVRYGELDEPGLEGAEVLELGPGDNLGIALRFLAAGAASVTCLDRFAAWRDEGQQREIHRALRGRLAAEERNRLEGIIGEDGRVLAFERLRVIDGLGVEDAGARLPRDAFDLIVSRAVLEYVQPIERAFEVMGRALGPDGLMLHKVDLRDHGLFTAAGLHPLTFLTIPTPVYSRISGHTGIPNRARADDYMRMASGLGLEADSLITHLVGDPEERIPHRARPEPAALAEAVGLVSEIRPSLARAFRDRSDEVLAVAGTFLIARRPARAQA